MQLQLDEELARTSTVGQLTHRVIAALAAKHAAPSPEHIKAAVCAALPSFSPIEARAHRQNIAGGAFAYFRFLRPPDGWLFIGAEVALGTGRVDLVWRDPDGRLLVDEVKTGDARQLGLSRTKAQVNDYLDCARRAWGDRLAGLRLLSTTDPSRSLFIHPDGTQQLLRVTAYRKGL